MSQSGLWASYRCHREDDTKCGQFATENGIHSLLNYYVTVDITLVKGLAIFITYLGFSAIHRARANCEQRVSALLL